MRRALPFLLLGAFLAVPASSQDDERGRLERLIEDNLSAEGMQIDIEGFRGALSSEAQLESLTIADENGVWLELRGAVLDWNRTALLRGRVSVNALTADEIVLSRLPGQPADGTVEVPDAETQPFSLPELPVSIQIGEISAERVELGEPVIGQPVELSLEGSASLQGGEGEVTLDVNRIDDRQGEVTLAGSYANETGVLSVNLEVDEGEGGIVASLAGIPGEPPLNLSVEGEGPLTDFTADLAFATDGEDRLSGQIRIRESETGARGFNVAIDGDIRPLLTPENREFFGPNLSLDVAGRRFPSGALEIDTLEVASDAINLSGNLQLSENQWPVRFSLQGEVAGADGGPVALPIPGQDTRLDRTVIDVAYDSETGNEWRADIAVEGLRRPDLTAESFTLDGGGTLVRGDGAAEGGASGTLDMSGDGLAFSNPDLETAVGTTLSGLVNFDWTEGQPLQLTGIDLSGAGVSATGDVEVSGLANDLNIVIAPDLAVVAEDISRFSGLAGRDLAGSVDVQTSGTFEPVTGAFDMAVNGAATGIETGIPEADGLIAGRIDLSLDAARNEAGIILRGLDVRSDALTLTAEGRVASSDTDARFDLDIADISDVRPELSGPVRLSGTVVQEAEDYTLDVTGNGPGGARIDAAVTATLVENVLQAVAGDGEVRVDTLDTYASIAGRPIAGAVQITGTGRYNLETQGGAADVTGSANDLAVGIPEVDALLDGATEFTLDAGRDETGITLRELVLDAPRADITAEGSYQDDGSSARFDVALRELQAVVPSLSGAATLSGTASQDGDTWSYDITGDAPGGVDLDIAGTAEVVADRLREVAATGDIAAEDISVYSGLADREIGGALTLSGSGSYALETQFFTADVSGETTDIVTGIEPVDAILEGTMTLDIDALRNEDGITVNSLDLQSPRLSVTGEGVYAESGSRANFDATLSDLAAIAEGMDGSASLRGTAEQDGDALNFDITGSGPGGASADLDGTATLDGLDLTAVEAAGTLGVDTLAPFSDLAGRDLGGSAQFEGSGRYEMDSQFFSADVTGRSVDVVTGIDQADTLLAGTVTYDIDAAREEDGITVRNLQIVAPRASVTAAGGYRAEDSAFDILAEMTDVADVVPGLSGPARVDARAERTGPETWDVTADASGPGGAQADIDATARVVDNALERVEGNGTVSVASLSPYGALANQSLGGSVSIEGSGAYTMETGAFEADVDGSANNLSTGIAAVDQLIGGTTTFGATAARGTDGIIRIDRLNVDAAEIDAQVQGTYGESSGNLDYDVRLRDVGVFVTDLNGPATANGTATITPAGYNIDTALTGPGGADATVAGTIARDFGSANLSANGTVPLGLANPFLEPNILEGTASLSLNVNGPLALESVSGTVSTSNAAFVVAGQGIALEGISAQIGLSGGQANIDLTGGLSTGGTVTVSGPVTLSSPFNGDLAIALNNLVVTDPGLYETELNGTLSLAGPLASTATLSGRIDVGRTEVRVPAGGASASRLSFGIEHVGTPPAVRQTQARAGLLGGADDAGDVEEGAGGGGGGVNYGLDVTIAAPSQIFIRGRGLDAELGGELYVGGTIQSPEPAGQFELIRGRLDILGQRLTLSEASVVLQGDLNPFITVRADTERDDNTITILIEGPVSDPEVTFSSSPDRPQEEVLALLLFGRDLSEISGLQALRIATAINTLAGRSGTSVVDRLRQSTGLDDIDIQTGADGQTELRLGRYINDRTYTDVTVNSEGETEINLNLTISKSITARGTAGTDGNTGVGVYYERDY
ncbi:translocation/assembly module TamB domain-containing protein [Roseivivax sediminis]|uniref:Autotransporter translocation and assembly factor TamB n=1 Tax=Roseivivax sediminis TaxID=936889 RepID=A0A1I2ARD9_9RHOB|nr:translocation/assembly module TamB domain-containing protein [Roseivivax sediminis]SFE46564.1 Autotransporter translocation and assembly factor TamB [Roseivivax sediminis]